MRCPDKIDLSDETSKNAKTYPCALEAGHEGPHEMRMRVQWDAIAEECFHQQEQPAEDGGGEMKFQLDVAIGEVEKWKEGTLSKEEQAWMEQLAEWLKELGIRREKCRCSQVEGGNHYYTTPGSNSFT